MSCSSDRATDSKLYEEIAPPQTGGPKSVTKRKKTVGHKTIKQKLIGFNRKRKSALKYHVSIADPNNYENPLVKEPQPHFSGGTYEDAESTPKLPKRILPNPKSGQENGPYPNNHEKPVVKEPHAHTSRGTNEDAESTPKLPKREIPKLKPAKENGPYIQMDLIEKDEEPTEYANTDLRIKN